MHTHTHTGAHAKRDKYQSAVCWFIHPMTATTRAWPRTKPRASPESPVWGGSLNRWATFCCFSHAFSRELNGKRSGYDRNWCPHVMLWSQVVLCLLRYNIGSPFWNLNHTNVTNVQKINLKQQLIHLFWQVSYWSAAASNSKISIEHPWTLPTPCLAGSSQPESLVS